MVLSLSTRAYGGQSVHTTQAVYRLATISSRRECSTICCMYKMYPPEDEPLWLETFRGVIFYK